MYILLILDKGSKFRVYKSYRRFSSTNTYINPDGGNVGINTRNPDFRTSLDVNGLLKSKSIWIPGGQNGYVLTSGLDGLARWESPSFLNYWYKNGNTLGTPTSIAIGQSNYSASAPLDLKTQNGDKILMGNGGNSSISFLPFSLNTGNSWFHIHHTHDNSLQISDGGLPGQNPQLTINNRGHLVLGLAKSELPDVGLDVRSGSGRISGNALYFWGGGRPNGDLPYCRLVESWGMRFDSPDKRWVLSTSGSFLVGYQPQGANYGDGNIYASGKVGIGTTDTKDAQLNVNGKLLTSTFQMTSGAKQNNVLSCDEYGNAFWRSPMDLYWSPGNGFVYYNGNVSIGMTCNQGYKLQVNGNVRFRKIRVDADAWCDSVFEPNFILPKLNEVEHYIKKNKHLDGIPAQSDVLTQGYDMSSFDASILGKVEQLYLYIIEQEKRLLKQNDEIEKLKKLLNEK